MTRRSEGYAGLVLTEDCREAPEAPEIYRVEFALVDNFWRDPESFRHVGSDA